MANDICFLPILILRARVKICIERYVGRWPKTACTHGSCLSLRLTIVWEAPSCEVSKFQPSERTQFSFFCCSLMQAFSCAWHNRTWKESYNSKRVKDQASSLPGSSRSVLCLIAVCMQETQGALRFVLWGQPVLSKDPSHQSFFFPSF